MAEDSVDFLQHLTLQCESIHNSVEGGYWSKRFSTAASCGFLDAKHMVYMSETFGFPLPDYVDKARKSYPSLKVCWSDLEHELLCIGKSKQSIQAMFSEMALI